MSADRWAEFERDVESGALPAVLRWQTEHGGWEEGARRYKSKELPATWEGWLEMWRGICWVHLQAFEREADAIAAMEGWE